MKTHSQNLQEYLVALTFLNNLYKEAEKEKYKKHSLARHKIHFSDFGN